MQTILRRRPRPIHIWHSAAMRSQHRAERQTPVIVKSTLEEMNSIVGFAHTSSILLAEI